jgi:iron complex outermembrane receptor protein
MGRLPRQALRMARTILLFGLFSCSPALALDDGEDLTQLSLEELLQVKIMSVTGSSRYEQEASEAPARVTVIDAATIQKYGYRTLSEALQGETGINMTYDRNYAYIGYRGFSMPGDYNTRVLVLLDGIRLNDEVYHQAPLGTDFPLDMDLVERIEIIRGPSNSLYGNNAFMLTVNVITVSARRNGVSIASSIDTRSQVTGRVTAEADPKGADWSLLVSGTLTHAPGNDLYFSAYDDPANNNGRSKNCDYEGNGSFFLKAEKGDLTLLGGFSRRRKGVPTGAFDVVFNDDGNTSWDERSFADLSYMKGSGSGDSLKARAYYNGYFYKERYIYSPDPKFYDYSESAVLGGEVVVSRKLPFDNHLVGGVDYHYALLRGQRSKTEGEGTALDLHSPQHSLGLFLQNEWRISPNLLFDVGVRYDYFSPSLHTFNPKAALIYKITDDLVAKYLFGRSFRAPNAYETDYKDSASNWKDNPDLKEESMISHELVLEYYHGPGQRLSMTWFHYSIKDLINQAVESDGSTMFENTDRARITGFELEGEWTWEAWSGRLGYSYQKARDLEHHTTLTNSPESLVKAKLSRDLFNRRLTLSGELQYLSQVDTLVEGVKGGNYALLHLTALARNLLIKNLDATISVRNLLNESYTNPGSNDHVETSYPVALIPQDGRTVTFKLEYRF